MLRPRASLALDQLCCTSPSQISEQILILTDPKFKLRRPMRSGAEHVQRRRTLANFGAQRDAGRQTHGAKALT